MATLLPSGTLLNGRYSILQLVRVGNKGAVYLATDTQAAAKSVLIRELFDSSPEAQNRFLREAQILSALEHTALPPVIDRFIEPSGRQYLTMGQVEGIDLEDAGAHNGALPEARVLAWFDRILAVVEYLHTQHPPIVHGGITPASITISGDGTPHVTDLAGVNGLPEAGAGNAASSAFVAPELYTGRIDERTDIYSLGATLYALLTGKIPPTAQARQGGAALPAPREANPAISRHVEVAIQKAMALEPGQRFRNVAEMWRALQRSGNSKRSPLLAMVAVGGVLVVCLAAGALVMAGPGLPFLRQGLAALQLASLGPAKPATATVAIPTPTLSPTELVLQAPTAALTLAPTAGRTATVAVPTGAPVMPTETPYPATPTKATATAVPSKQGTLLPAVTATRASATPTTRSFPAPRLLAPGDGASVNGEVEFQWYWNEPLRADEYFDLQVWRVGAAPGGAAWCKEPRYRTSYLPGGDGPYRWRVQVVRGSAGQVLATVTGLSEERGFDWRAAGAPATSVPLPTATDLPTQPPQPPTAQPTPTSAYPWPTKAPATLVPTKIPSPPYP